MKRGTEQGRLFYGERKNRNATQRGAGRERMEPEKN